LACPIKKIIQRERKESGKWKVERGKEERGKEGKRERGKRKKKKSDQHG
jgi:hypothetical protein